MSKIFKIGDKFWDDRNGRYLTITGVCGDPNRISCVEEEIEEGDLVVTGHPLMTAYDLRHMMEVEHD